MNIEKSKQRLLHLINEAEQKITEAEKAGDREIKAYYQGSLYCAKMIVLGMDCKIGESNGKKIIIDEGVKKNIGNTTNGYSYI